MLQNAALQLVQSMCDGSNNNTNIDSSNDEQQQREQRQQQEYYKACRQEQQHTEAAAYPAEIDEDLYLPTPLNRNRDHVCKKYQNGQVLLYYSGVS